MGNTYYPVERYEKNGRSFARELPGKRTFKAAMRVLDDRGSAGWVSVWSERTQGRFVAAKRHPDGRWTARDVHTGEETDVEES